MSYDKHFQKAERIFRITGVNLKASEKVDIEQLRAKLPTFYKKHKFLEEKRIDFQVVMDIHLFSERYKENGGFIFEFHIC